MEKLGKTDATGRGGHLGVSPVIHSGDTGSPDVWVGIMGDARYNYDGGRGRPCGASMSYRGEVSEASVRRVMGDTGI